MCVVSHSDGSSVPWTAGDTPGGDFSPPGQQDEETGAGPSKPEHTWQERENRKAAEGRKGNAAEVDGRRPWTQPRKDRGATKAMGKCQRPRNSQRKTQTRTKDVRVQTVNTALLIRAKYWK